MWTLIADDLDEEPKNDGIAFKKKALTLNYRQDGIEGQIIFY